VNFDSFSFHPQIQAGIKAAGYTTPTPIQAQAIPAALDGRDLLGLAQTGTGKTAAFVLPILQRLADGPRGKLRALVLSPTRELAEQTHDAIRTLGYPSGLRSLTVYGGVNANPQIKGLRQGVDIVVACPGRLLDLMGQRAVDLRQVAVVVLDEADRMFDMGFLPDVRRILAALPAQRQTMLCCAFCSKKPAAARCWYSPAPSTALASWPPNWPNPACRPPPCRAICRRVSARKRWIASAAGACACWWQPISPRAASTSPRLHT
jgi:ATP-dependent RNA helicase RhlE